MRRPYRGGISSNKRRNDNGGKHRSQETGRSRLNSNWMKGVKVCFVCGKDHYDRTLHSREEVTEAIKRLKENHPTSLLTIEYLHSVMEMAAREAEKDDGEDDNVIWNEDGDSSDESEIALIAQTDLMEVEMKLTDSAFIHGYISPNTPTSTPLTMTSADASPVNGVIIDTAANRRSIMSLKQYCAYQHEFGR